MTLLTAGTDRFFVEQHGQGEPIVVIPGLANDLSELTALIAALAGGLAVTGIDNLGAGRSDKPDEPYTLSRMAAGPAVALRELTGPATVLGISMGSRIAMAVALEHPELVRRLVLVSGSARVVRSVWSRTLMGTLPRLPIGKGAHPQPYYAFRRQLAVSGGVDLRPRLADIVSPTLVAHARRDRIARPALAVELAAGIPDARLEWFAGGHAFPIFGREIPRLAAVVTAFARA